MVTNISNFVLTESNAKEYFFLHRCSLRNIDYDCDANAAKFRSFNFDEATLDLWTNEWLSNQLRNTTSEWVQFHFHSLIDDLGYRTDSENARTLISIYRNLVPKIETEERIAILLRHKFSEVLNEHFYFGLIFITARNKMTDELKPLIDELNDLLKKQPNEIQKDYSKYLKNLLETIEF